MKSTGVLLVNLGSPDSPSVPAVRRYLREFLMDARVIDLPWWQRFLVVHLFILPFRPARSAEAYRKIWRREGSPLVIISRQVQAALQQRLPWPVELAMRYQRPSLAEGLRRLLDHSLSNLILAPLYPHYAASSYETVVVRAREVLAELAPDLPLKIVPPFFADPHYLDALVASAQAYLDTGFDHLLFSFHGLPERHLRKADPTGHHCLQTPECCKTASPAHEFCYRAQAFRTVSAFVQKTGLPPNRYSVAFQSRLGREPWLRPYTDFEIPRLAQSGVRKLLVMCPAFVSDCLETLEEIGLRGMESFRQSGGDQLTLIPCLNDHPRWIDALERLIRRQA